MLILHSRFEQIEEKRLDWIDFSDRCRLASPFCGARTWIAWLQSNPSLEPAVYEWHDQGELRAIVPMFRQGANLEMAGGPHLDYQDILAYSDKDAARALIAIADLESSRCNSLCFPKVVEQSRLANALRSLQDSDAYHIKSRYWSQCPVSTISIGPGEKADFFTVLPSRQRKDYRNASRRIREAFPEYSVEHLGPGRIPYEKFMEAGELHKANQHRKTGDSIFTNPDFLAFIESLCVDDSSLCLSLLREYEGGPLLAFHMGFVGDSTFYDYLTSYSGAHTKLSAGRWLLVDTMRHWYERFPEGDFHLDMLSGEEAYKFRWPTESYIVTRNIVLPHRISNLARILTYTALYGLKNAKNRILFDSFHRSRRVSRETQLIR